MAEVRLCGVGLHSGTNVSVTLVRTSERTSLVQRGNRAHLDELEVTRTDHGVAVTNREKSLCVDLVEHFFAALSVLNARDGVEARIDGPEFPLLGGGAAEWLSALEMLGLEQREPSSKIVKRASLTYGTSVYDFAPGETTRATVTVEFGGRLGVQSAFFDGDLAQFRREIADARTFGFVRDAERLRGMGRAAHVDPASVLVFDDEGILALPSRPPRDNELGAHKLLDFVGDSFLYGGVPRGTLHAQRPGHGPNHAMFADARAAGIIVDA